ncbi:hypothetical protein [Variovorax sp.]|uniref:hypothetical protein n=1 Tax=Variovorax sp. TaxID=1871043 RepID=UPI002D5A0AC0|nr:hypothetical protein [Variovorax sp.]HYP84610.1 hypothetical protein [Variovorax sp.]
MTALMEAVVPVAVVVGEPEAERVAVPGAQVVAVVLLVARAALVVVQAQGTTPPRRDPLVLDLDGDGIETTSTRDGTVILFDHDADGVKTGTGWVKSDDGWLVLDRNGNGTIASGRELFGVDTLKATGRF